MTKLRVLDTFAGIGSFSLAFERAGAKTVCQIEINDKRCEVLASHFPESQRLNDIRGVSKDDITETIDIFTGGTPCQNLSIAGNGKGLAGEESKLWFEYLRLAQELTPRWLVWENVPNALSSSGGQDFLTILRGLDECGYHVAWRVLDAQYFGVPQRRRRIFLVGHLGDGRAAQVLFEPESRKGTSQTRPETWQRNSTRVSGTLAASGAGSAPAGQRNELDMLVYHRQFAGAGFKSQNVARTLEKTGHKRSDNLIIAINPQASATASDVIRPNGVAGTLGTTRIEGVIHNSVVRRFTPLECERLQGFPANWTIGHSDTARYQMIGDSIAVPVAEWIAARIMDIDKN